MILCIYLLENPYDEVQLSQGHAIIPPFSELTVKVTVKAKEVHDTCRIPIAVSLTPMTLPAQLNYGLTSINPVLPALTQSLFSTTVTLLTLHLTEIKMRKYIQIGFSPHQLLRIGELVKRISQMKGILGIRKEITRLSRGLTHHREIFRLLGDKTKPNTHL